MEEEEGWRDGNVSVYESQKKFKSKDKIGEDISSISNHRDI